MVDLILSQCQSNCRIEYNNYQHVLTFIFAIQEINRDPNLLPNVSLGFKIYDNFFEGLATYESILHLLSKQQRNVPNYKCDKKGNVLSVIGGLTVEYVIQMATVLSRYKLPQVHKLVCLDRWDITVVLLSSDRLFVINKEWNQRLIGYKLRVSQMGPVLHSL